MKKIKPKSKVTAQRYTVPKNLEKYIRDFTDEEIREWLKEDKLDENSQGILRE